MASAPAISFGAAGVFSYDTETRDGIFSTLEKHNVKEIDTAIIYVSHPRRSGS
jgi:hypothetical protein